MLQYSFILGFFCVCNIYIVSICVCVIHVLFNFGLNLSVIFFPLFELACSC